MTKVTEILYAYTKGEKTLVETNEALKAAGAGFHLDINKHNFTPAEIVEKTAGLLDTGTGYMDKVIVDPEKLELVNADCGEMYALCIYAGETYNVEGKKLVK